MKIFAPDYYREFACIQGACRHSCCIGWEIDVDEDSLERFRQVQGPLGERLHSSICKGEEGAHFRLSEGDRCPFLNQEGLCDLILELGEDCLCQICDDHPRFRNFFADREEIGLGLCCEAAGRLILGRKEKARLVEIEDDGWDEDVLTPEEEKLLVLREHMIEIAQKDCLALEERIRRILELAGVQDTGFCMNDWADFLLQLERLDDAWTDLLDKAGTSSIEYEPTALNSAFEQLMVYLLYRHISSSVEDGDIAGHAAYAAFAWRLIRSLCACAQIRSIEEMVEICRLYSSEIEYSDTNIGEIISRLHEMIIRHE